MNSLRTRINNIVYKHMIGRHNQKLHGNRRGGRLYSDVTVRSGFSYSPVSNSSPKTGFMLSVNPDNERKYDLNTFSKNDINNYIKEHAHLINGKNTFLGGWIDGNKVYLDISINVQSKSNADRLAKKYNQLAYYDIAKGETVYVK